MPGHIVLRLLKIGRDLVNRRHAKHESKSIMEEGQGVIDEFQRSFDLLAADTAELKQACFRLRYQVYCLENPFEDPNRFPDGCETDGFDGRSAHALMVDRRTRDPIGTCRLVLPVPPTAEGHGATSIRRLPVEDACPGRWSDPERFPPGRVGEISRFCIAKAHRKGRRVGEAKLGLLQMAFRLALAHRLTHVCCVMDPLLLRIFDRLGLDFGPYGPPVEYHGRRQPCVTGIAELFAKARRARPDVWEIVTDHGELAEAAATPGPDQTRSAAAPRRPTSRPADDDGAEMAPALALAS
jgi:N-acyl-L-homoserine lactone synthetase